MIIHILPKNDLEPHEEEGTICKCNPRVEFVEGGMLVIHNAYDNREIIEQVNQILKGDQNDESNI
jgi:hypothetical protein